VDFAYSIARFLDVFGRWRERDAMMEQVSKFASLQVASQEGLTKAEYLMLDRQGDTLLQKGQAAEAERVFRGLLERLETSAAYDAAYDHAMTLARLGRCLEAQGRPGQAIDYHRRALGEFERLSESNEQVKRMMGKVYPDLGDNLAALGRFEEAQCAYEDGLEIANEVGDHRTVGVALGQLGTLAEMRGDLAEAARRYTDILETFRALGEPQSEAVAWHQLGRVAQEARDWDEAERCYREALKLEEQTDNKPYAASTCNQLAIVAEGAGRLDDAERWYLRAIELDEQLGNPKEVAIDYSNLADLYLSQGHLDEASCYAHRAREIKETLDLSAEPWKTYAILAQIAEAQRRTGEAAQWRRKEQESYAAYAGAAHQLPQWAPSFIAAVVAAVQGNEEARAEVEQILPQMESSRDWRNLPPIIRRILDGESDADKLCTGLDRYDAYIANAILAQLAGEVPQTPGVSETPGVSPASPADASTAIARIRQQWAPVIQAVVAACGGNRQAAAQLEPLLAQLSIQDDWRHLAAALRRILAGERDPAALLPGLDPTDLVIASDVLHGLGVDVGQDLRGFGNLGGLPEPGEGAMSLDDLFDMVALACTPQAPPGLAEQLHGLTHTVATDPNAPPEFRTLCRVLNAVLSGEHAPDTSALPPEWADKVREMLAAL
jgi:tetratricopeptide (TPR) repeat protein